LKPVSAIARSSAVAVAARVVFAVLSPDQLQRQMRVLLQLLANVLKSGNSRRACRSGRSATSNAASIRSSFQPSGNGQAHLEWTRHAW
jgi:hypothetical protein